MHLSRVYCLLPGPPTTSKLSRVSRVSSNLLYSATICTTCTTPPFCLSALSSVCSLCTRSTSVTNKRWPENWEPVSLGWRVMTRNDRSVPRFWGLCRSDVWQVVLVMIIRGLGTEIRDRLWPTHTSQSHGHAIGDVSVSPPQCVLISVRIL